MAESLYEHFQLPVNAKVLQREGNRLELFKKFHLMVQECQAILKCSKTENVEEQRIMKRFKILRSILRKFIDELGDRNGNVGGNRSQVFIMSDELSDSQQMFASIGISPSIRSILYNNQTPMEKRREQRLLNDSLKANYSKLPLTPLATQNSNENIIKTNSKTSKMPQTPTDFVKIKPLPTNPAIQTRASLRRSKYYKKFTIS